jgi:antitoxin component YwqK of YwqJK toxin-antitoxin module
MEVTMAQKELLRNKFLLIFATVCVFVVSNYDNDQKQTRQVANIKNYTVDISVIPKDTVFTTDEKLTLVNGLYLYKNKSFAGIVIELYPSGVIKKQMSIYKGMLHGTYTSFYENKKPWEIRTYKNNLSTGIHYGFWAENGKPKFEYNYYEEKMEGLQKKWYPSGKPYFALHYVNDREEGLQQGWRENGKLFLNYEAKDGFRYGLQKAALCYTLRDEKLN